MVGLLGLAGIPVSTHSRLKAAGAEIKTGRRAVIVSTHSRLKAAGPKFERTSKHFRVSTHSRLKAAGQLVKGFLNENWFQHTAA